MRTRWRWGLRALVLGGSLAALAGCHGGAHLELTVTTTVDGADAVPGDGVCEMTASAGDCSLRAAIDEANAQPATARTGIAVPTGTYVLTGSPDEDANASGDLDVVGDVTISASGPGVVIDGGGVDRVLDVHGTLALNRLTVTGGTNAGAASPTSYNGGGVQVGAGADARIHLVTLTGNAANAGGGLAVYPGAAADLLLSTISANTATNAFGVAGGVASGGTTSLVSSTVTANAGGGVGQEGGTLSAASTIVADQASGTDCYGTLTSAGHNLDSDGTCLGTPTTGDVASGTARLDPLTDNGGFTPTHLPQGGSDALDGDDPASTLTVDQRQAPRPQGAAGDIGSTETAITELRGADCLAPPVLAPGSDLRGCDLSGLDLTGVDLTGSDLARADLRGTTLQDTDLTGTDLYRLRSGGSSGFPSALPAGWSQRVGPGGTGDLLLVGPGADLAGMDLTGVELTGADLTGADLTGATLTGASSGGIVGTPDALPTDWTLVAGLLLGPGADLRYQDLRGWDLTDATLPGADLGGADLAGATLDGADLTNASLSANDLTGTSLRGTDLTDATVQDPVLSGTDLGSATLVRTAIHFPTGSGADLSSADLTDATLQLLLGTYRFTGATLEGTDFTTTDLTGARSGGVVGTPASLPAGWRIGVGYLLGPGADLSGEDLSGLDLAGIDLAGVHLDAADLATADLPGVQSGAITGTPAGLPADWRLIEGFLLGPGADLAGEDLSSIGTCAPDCLSSGLSGAVLVGADLTGTDLARSNLRGADLSAATLVGASLNTANLTDARFVGADLRSADLVSSEQTSTDLTGADLRNATITYGNVGWPGPDMSAADLSGAVVRFAPATTITGATISGADLTLSYVDELRSGGLVGVPAVLCPGCGVAGGYLLGPGADLSGAALDGLYLFSSVDLTGTDLTGASLRLAYLGDAPLAGAVLDAADLSGSWLADADLAGTSLDGTDLTDVRLDGATGTPSSWASATYANTTCPTLVNSDLNGGTCAGQPWA